MSVETAIQERKHLGLGAYALAFGSLLALSALTFGLSRLELGPLEVPVALGIASVKAIVVVLFFMHLAEQRKGNVVMLAISVMLLAVLVALMAADVATRDPGIVIASPFPREHVPPTHVLH